MSSCICRSLSFRSDCYTLKHRHSYLFIFVEGKGIKLSVVSVVSSSVRVSGVCVSKEAERRDQTHCVFSLLAVVQDSCARVLLFRGANKEIKNYNSQTAFQVIFFMLSILSLSKLNQSCELFCFLFNHGSMSFSPSLFAVLSPASLPCANFSDSSAADPGTDCQSQVE